VGSTTSFDRVADSYDATRGGEERGRIFAADLDPAFVDGMAVEIGIGTGVVAKGLAELGRYVVGIDIAPRMLAQARARIGSRVAVADALHLPLSSDSVTNAYSVWVLHLLDISAVMSEVVRILRKDGRFVATPAGEVEPDAILDVLRPMFRTLRGSDERPDDPARVIAAAEAAGLRHIRTVTGREHRFSESPEDVARWVESRGGSALWGVDDETWERVVTPTIHTLRAMPAADRPIERLSRPRIIVFGR
jgi:SAM-dependent methyltransferase